MPAETQRVLSGVCLDGLLAYRATDEVQAAVASIGQTEDVTFSPDNRRLAIAGYRAGSILLIDIAMDFSAGRKDIALTGVVEVGSPGLNEPHGFAFVGTERLVVADRAGTVSLLTIPAAGSGPRKVMVPAQSLSGDAGFAKLDSPGSVTVVAAGWGGHDILVCDNYVHRVTRHRLHVSAGSITNSMVLLANGLSIPDGVAVSPSKRWIAVSNHTTGSVVIYRNKRRLNARTRPVGALAGVRCAHGVRFTADGKFALVADAGAPVVRIFSATGDDWRGERQRMKSFPVMLGETYVRGMATPQDGGPKGIDVDRGMNALVVTSELQPLAFFDLATVLRN